MRKNNKVVVIRIPDDEWIEIKKQAVAEKLTVAEKARRYLRKGMEKLNSNS